MWGIYSLKSHSDNDDSAKSGADEYIGDLDDDNDDNNDDDDDDDDDGKVDNRNIIVRITMG